MPTDYCVTPETLSKFKRPFGTLIQGDSAETMRKLEAMVEKEKPTMIISVGDTVSRNLHKHHLNPKLAVTDDRSMRRKLEPKVFPGRNLIRVRNPQGTITQEAIAALRNALEANADTQILVEGEEDLLTLVAVLYAAENSLVIYGQPKLGIVVVKVTAEKKAEAREILNSLRTVQAG